MERGEKGLRKDMIKDYMKVRADWFMTLVLYCIIIKITAKYSLIKNYVYI